MMVAQHVFYGNKRKSSTLFEISPFSSIVSADNAKRPAASKQQAFSSFTPAQYPLELL
jgi:hypothetical protein